MALQHNYEKHSLGIKNANFFLRLKAGGAKRAYMMECIMENMRV